MDNSDKIILDLCGGTGAWSRPYHEAGYDVRVLTLPDWDVEKLWGEGFWLQQGRREVCRYDRVHGILAAPPCTEFSIAKGNKPRNLSAAMGTVNACMRVIHWCRLWGNLKFWALENPRGLLRQFLGIPHYTFEQWQFGGNKRKATDLWGYFNDPKPTVKTPPDMLTDGRTHAHAADWTRCDYPPEYEAYMSQFKGDDKRAAARAITPRGFAEAFYRANK